MYWSFALSYDPAIASTNAFVAFHSDFRKGFTVSSFLDTITDTVPQSNHPFHLVALLTAITSERLASLVENHHVGLLRVLDSIGGTNPSSWQIREALLLDRNLSRNETHQLLMETHLNLIYPNYNFTQLLLQQLKKDLVDFEAQNTALVSQISRSNVLENTNAIKRFISVYGALMDGVNLSRKWEQEALEMQMKVVSYALCPVIIWLIEMWSRRHSLADIIAVFYTNCLLATQPHTVRGQQAHHPTRQRFNKGLQCYEGYYNHYSCIPPGKDYQFLKMSILAHVRSHTCMKEFGRLQKLVLTLWACRVHILAAFLV